MVRLMPKNITQEYLLTVLLFLMLRPRPPSLLVTQSVLVYGASASAIPTDTFAAYMSHFLIHQYNNIKQWSLWC
jgi:hypothetical protein